MNDTTIKLRVPTDDLLRWKQWADGAGQNMSEWIRARCNGFGLAVGPSPERVEEVIQALEKPKRLIKQCKHGVDRGYHCWQCMGLAIIAKEE